MTSYSKQTWVDGSGGGTPISAGRLNHMEDGIEAASVSGATPGVGDFMVRFTAAVADAVANPILKWRAVEAEQAEQLGSSFAFAGGDIDLLLDGIYAVAFATNWLDSSGRRGFGLDVSGNSYIDETDGAVLPLGNQMFTYTGFLPAGPFELRARIGEVAYAISDFDGQLSLAHVA